MKNMSIGITLLLALSIGIWGCKKEDKHDEVKAKLIGEWQRVAFEVDGVAIDTFSYRNIQLLSNDTYIAANDSAATSTFTGTWSVNKAGSSVSLSSIFSDAEIVLLSNTELIWEYTDDNDLLKQDSYQRQ